MQRYWTVSFITLFIISSQNDYYRSLVSSSSICFPNWSNNHNIVITLFNLDYADIHHCWLSKEERLVQVRTSILKQFLYKYVDEDLDRNVSISVNFLKELN